MLKYVEVDIRRSEMSTVRKQVAEWEVPILDVMHGQNGPIAVVREIPVDRPAPTGQEEMERLRSTYGVTRDENGMRGITYVESVYGQHRPGVQTLERAIQAAQMDMPQTYADDLLGGAQHVTVGVG